MKIKILLITLFSLALSSVVWNLIDDDKKILKYIIFILIPLFIYIISRYKFFPNENIKPVYLIINSHKEIILDKKFFVSKLIFSYFVFFLFVEFYFLDFPLFKIDTQHEGNYLAPFQNYQLTGNIWISNYFVHGISDLFYPILGLKLFNYSTIGSFRLSFLLIILFLKLLSLILANELTKLLKIDKLSKKIFFFFLGVSFLHLSDYEIPLNYVPFSARHIFTVIFLIFFIQLVCFCNNNKVEKLYLFIISLISSFSIIFHTDIGIYLNIVLFSYIFYLLLIKKYFNIFIILFYILIFWISLIISLGSNEIISFFKQLILTLQNIEIIHGLEYQYPSPFISIGSKDGMRATKGLLMQITAGIFIFNYIMSKNNYSNNFKIFFLFLYILSFFSYFNALGRADSYHMKLSSGLPIIINIFFLLDFIIRKINLSYYIKNKNLLKKNVLYTLILVLFVIFNTNFVKNINFIFKKNYNEYLLIKDDFYLDNETNNFINFFSQISSNDVCVQNFTDDLILNFLLKKQSCTKYFSSVFAITSKLQHDYINELTISNPKYIIYKSEKFKIDNKHPAEKLKIINNFILSNYKKYSVIDNYEIFIKK